VEAAAGRESKQIDLLYYQYAYPVWRWKGRGPWNPGRCVITPPLLLLEMGGCDDGREADEQQSKKKKKAVVQQSSPEESLAVRAILPGPMLEIAFLLCLNSSYPQIMHLFFWLCQHGFCIVCQLEINKCKAYPVGNQLIKLSKGSFQPRGARAAR
jgi:hypothetical protein